MERLRTIDLTGAHRFGSASFADLAKKVERDDGHLNILVHPYYDRAEFGDEYQEYMDQRRCFIRAAMQSDLPIVIFEEQGRLEGLGALIEQETRRKAMVERDVFVVPTLPGNPKPTIGWRKTIKALKNAGVKNVSIGGAWLHFREDGPDLYLAFSVNKDFRKLRQEKNGDKLLADSWVGDRRYPYACVGTTGKRLLKSGIDVWFSSASTPYVPPAPEVIFKERVSP